VKSAKETYQQNISQYQGLLRQQTQTSHRLSNMRLFISLGGMAGAIYLYVRGLHSFAAVIFFITAGLFIWLVRRHQKVNLEKKYSAIMLNINQLSLARLSEDWTSFPDLGKELLEEDHPYAVDLDIFGKRSLFQLINTTNTFIGRQKLKNLLLDFPRERSLILDRQKAIEELAVKLHWRQRYQSEGIILSGTGSNPDDLIKWALSPKDLFLNPWSIFFIRLSPLITISLIILAFVLPGSVPYFLPLSFVLIHMVLLLASARKSAGTFAVASKYKDHIKSFSNMLQLFEQEQFHSPYIKRLKESLKNQTHLPAYQQIRILEKAVDMTYVRFHQLYVLFNIITLWDFQCQISLERWKKQCGKLLEGWLKTIGEVEALSSCALLAFDHPDWSWPEITPGLPRVQAKNMGHPLLPESRVCNDVEISKPGEILLITGSNMSGKSTLLRTIGLNLVLAYIGCPVCAEKFSSSVMEIYTSMRINDNLDTGTSSFLAELLRIKRILEEAQKEKSLIFLLDEIFRGTNSRDRHTGAKHLIKKLSRSGVVGLVSTHDLELGDLAQENNLPIRNFHFEEYYQNGHIHFDYKLRPGISTTRNAIYLMRMAGIEVD